MSSVVLGASDPRPPARRRWSYLTAAPRRAGSGRTRIACPGREPRLQGTMQRWMCYCAGAGRPAGAVGGGRQRTAFPDVEPRTVVAAAGRSLGVRGRAARRLGRGGDQGRHPRRRDRHERESSSNSGSWCDGGRREAPGSSSRAARRTPRRRAGSAASPSLMTGRAEAGAVRASRGGRERHLAPHDLAGAVEADPPRGRESAEDEQSSAAFAGDIRPQPMWRPPTGVGHLDDEPVDEPAQSQPTGTSGVGYSVGHEFAGEQRGVVDDGGRDAPARQRRGDETAGGAGGPVVALQVDDRRGGRSAWATRTASSATSS